MGPTTLSGMCPRVRPTSSHVLLSMIKKVGDVANDNDDYYYDNGDDNESLFVNLSKKCLSLT